MPYKDSKDKQEWRKRDRARQRENTRKWMNRNREKVNSRARARYRAKHPTKPRVKLHNAREHDRKMKERVDAYKMSKGCSRCGYNEHPAALDLHHRDPNEKSFGISNRRNIAWSKLLTEIEKCDVLCANCHRIDSVKTGVHQHRNGKDAPTSDAQMSIEF